MKTYHLPDSGGSYISRYRSISSHIKLTLFIDESIEYFSIYFTTILLDFMAYSSHIISKIYHLDSLIHSVEQAKRKFKREFKKCASSYNQFKRTVLFINIIDRVFIMPNIEHIADSSISSILDNSIKTPSAFNSNEDYERYFTIKNRKYSVEAEYLENVRTPTHKTYKTLDLVPRLPRDDFYIRYGNESRIHQFLSKYPDRITTWTEDINRSNNIANDINNSTLASSTLSPSDSSANSKTVKAYSSASSSDSENSVSPPATVPTSLPTPSSSLPVPNMDITLLARERRHVTKYATPTTKPRMNLLMANDIKRMASVRARSSLQILDSGAGISGVGEQWKMTDISRSSTYSIQGAFGEPMTPAVQGFLGPGKLPAAQVPGMRDYIYSLSSLLRANEHTGSPGKVAIFTEPGAVVLKSESCQKLLQQAIHQGSQTHVADQVDGIYVLRPASMTTMAHVHSFSTPHAN